LAEGACGKAELNLLSALVVRDVRGGDTFHTEDLDFVIISSRKCILDPRKTK
jgi:hypothetical protein